MGSAVHLDAPVSFAAGDGVRLDFASWEGTGGGTFPAAAGYHKVTAHYSLSHRLALSSSPAGAGSWRVSPPSADGFYPAGSWVSVGVELGITARWYPDPMRAFRN